jgi:hypothetical protein
MILNFLQTLGGRNMSQTALATYDGEPLSSLEYTFQLGVTPGSGTIKIPNHSFNVSNVGTIFVSDGTSSITLDSMYILNGREDDSEGGGSDIVCTVYDRRILWKWTPIVGHYNKQDEKGLPNHEKTITQLFTILFEALEEERFSLVDLPEIYPEVNWEVESVASAMQDLLDRHGLVLGYSPSSNGTYIISASNYDVAMPTQNLDSSSSTISPPVIPAKILFVGARNIYQYTFDSFIPVGEDVDGNVRPINLLSYAPEGANDPSTGIGDETYEAWSQEVINCFSNIADPVARELAQKTIFKWFMIDWDALEFVDGYTRDSILPLMNVISDVVIVEGVSEHDKPYLLGERTMWDGSSYKTYPEAQIREGYTIDKKLGIVQFNKIQYKVAADGPIAGSILPPPFSLIAAFESKLGGVADFLTKEYTVTNGVSGTYIHKETSLRGYWKWSVPSQAFVLEDSSNIYTYMDSIAALIDQQLNVKDPEEVTVVGVSTIGAYGLINTMNISFDAQDGCSTHISKAMDVPRLRNEGFKDKHRKRFIDYDACAMYKDGKIHDRQRSQLGSGDTQKRNDNNNSEKSDLGIYGDRIKDAVIAYNTSEEDIPAGSSAEVVDYDESSQVYTVQKCVNPGRPCLIIPELIPAGLKGIGFLSGIKYVHIDGVVTVGDVVGPAENSYNLVKTEENGSHVVISVATGGAYVKTAGGAGGGSFVEAQIIERPEYSIDGVPGRNYYTARLKKDTTNLYVGTTEYIMNDFCIGSDTKKYKSIKVDEGTGKNVGHDPVSSPEWWSQDEEIRITKIWGHKNLGQLMTDTCDWIDPGEKVLLYKDEDGEYYIMNPHITYTGDKWHSNMRYNVNAHCPQCVFA